MADDGLETLQARQKKELKALTAQITALKKTATKGDKSKKKEVLVEVERLEKETKDRQDRELRAYQSRGGDNTNDRDGTNLQSDASIEEPLPLEEETLPDALGRLTLSNSPKPNGKPKPNRQKARMVVNKFAI